MKSKGLLYKGIFYTLFVFALLIVGRGYSGQIWDNTIEKTNKYTERSTQRITESRLLIADSTSTLMVPNQPYKSIDIFVQPRVLNLNSKGKILISWIRLPDDYDPHAITSKSLELSVMSCPKCKIIYPTWQFPLHGQYLIVFSRQDLIDIVETMELALPTKLDLKIHGEMNNGIPFEGLETIWITNQKK